MQWPSQRLLNFPKPYKKVNSDNRHAVCPTKSFAINVLTKEWGSNKKIWIVYLFQCGGKGRKKNLKRKNERRLQKLKSCVWFCYSFRFWSKFFCRSAVSHRPQCPPLRTHAIFHETLELILNIDCDVVAQLCVIMFASSRASYLLCHRVRTRR